MKYNSTRDKSCRVGAAYAIAHGLAPDGGLFVPEELPPLSLQQIEALCKTDYRGRAEEILALFLDEFSREEIRAIVTAAYGDNYDDFTIAPLRRIDDKTAVLELWHGPTCAFKDMALQILPHLLTASLKKCGETRKVCILVATSGDTGKLCRCRGYENTCLLPPQRCVRCPKASDGHPARRQCFGCRSPR